MKKWYISRTTDICIFFIIFAKMMFLDSKLHKKLTHDVCQISYVKHLVWDLEDKWTRILRFSERSKRSRKTTLWIFRDSVIVCEVSLTEVYYCISVRISARAARKRHIILQITIMNHGNYLFQASSRRFMRLTRCTVKRGTLSVSDHAWSPLIERATNNRDIICVSR